MNPYQNAWFKLVVTGVFFGYTAAQAAYIGGATVRSCLIVGIGGLISAVYHNLADGPQEAQKTTPPPPATSVALH